MEYRINQLIDHALAAGRITGTVVLVHQHGAPVFRRAAGLADRETGQPVAFDTIFRLASVTKPIVAATALAMVERGLIALDDAVTRHLPWFRPTLADGRPARITVHHLLTHTSGLVYDPALESLPEDQRVTLGLSDTDLDFEANFSRFNARALAFEPGTQWAYGFSTDILGAIVAKVHGSTLEGAVVHYVSGPLGMADSRFHVTDPARLAVPYADAQPLPIRMPDPWICTAEDSWPIAFSPSRIFNPRAFQSGGGGMAGTADDLMAFFEALRTGGAGILKPETVELGLSNRIGAIRRLEPGMKFSYFGAVVDDPSAAMTPQSRGTVAWGGVYGLSWFIDREQGLTVVSATNNALEGCTGDYPARIVEAVYGV
jgi:CubicO group peptidase (beta-lactamase class C family)